MEFIPFNKPALVQRELEYVKDAVQRGHLSGNGYYSKKCRELFTEKIGFNSNVLTTSCTDALEMCAILLDIKKGDEVIIPSFTFVSTANAFVLRGAKIVFADSCEDHPNMDTRNLERLITEKTRAIVAVHYAGVQCDIEYLKDLCDRHNLYLVEDAAQAIDVQHNNRYLGSFGHLSTFSFHETKNVQCGEGGLLVINDQKFVERAEIILEKGTNRQKFFRGQVDKYRWVDIGSSFLPSELNTAFLYGQLNGLERIQIKRKAIIRRYDELLIPLLNEGNIGYNQNKLSPNGHLFYILLKSQLERAELIQFLKDQNILSVFHYQCLHLSPYYLGLHHKSQLPHAEYYDSHLLRLPLYYDMTMDQVERVATGISSFFKK